MTILRTMRNFSSMNIAASILLFVAAIAAAIIANSPVAPVYQEFLLHEFFICRLVILICFRMVERICG